MKLEIESLPNNSRMTIDVNTSVNPFLLRGEDYQEAIERILHQAVFERMEEVLQGEEFENDIIKKICSEVYDMYGFSIDEKVKEFEDLGSVLVSIIQGNINVKKFERISKNRKLTEFGVKKE